MTCFNDSLVDLLLEVQPFFYYCFLLTIFRVNSDSAGELDELLKSSKRQRKLPNRFIFPPPNTTEIDSDNEGELIQRGAKCKVCLIDYKNYFLLQAISFKRACDTLPWEQLSSYRFSPTI